MIDCWCVLGVSSVCHNFQGPLPDCWRYQSGWIETISPVTFSSSNDIAIVYLGPILSTRTSEMKFDIKDAIFTKSLFTFYIMSETLRHRQSF